MRKAQRGTAKAPPSRPWAREVGQATTFYLEGGHGDAYWSGGWHYGKIHAIPTRGQKFGWVQVKLQTPLYFWDDQKARWVPKPFARVWVRANNLNEPGDFIYHGPTAKETFRDRQDEKQKQQAKANKHRITRV